MFIPCDEISPLIEDEGRFINYPVFLFEEKKLFETYRVVLKKGGSQTSLAHLQGTEEYVTCFEGLIEVVVDGKAFVLNRGDSIKFRADVKHSYRNVGEETAALSMVIYYVEN
ncbi:cupin domain-containing protein [Eubacteriaceae bacterium ES2]|nr:cupin domain-containing protein [Eubacteriaceae bacterium ES2]